MSKGKGTVRERLLSQVENPAVWNIIDQLYRPNAKIGYGGTAAALRYERENNILNSKGEFTHREKAITRIVNIRRVLRTQVLTRREIEILRRILVDLKEALHGLF